jgi:hypothetical protein
MLGWAHCGFNKKRVGTSYTELEFLHPLPQGIQCISVSPGCKTSTHNLSCLGLIRCSYHKKRARTRYAQCVSTKKCRDTLGQICVIASGVIYGSCSAFWCVRGMKHRFTIFHPRMGLVRFPKKAVWDTLS